ncbi:hypothetical protein BGZ63DRAFT_508560, partial [Mariannaea sp. PMI_226]
MDTSFQNALAKFRTSLSEKQRRDFAPCTLKDVQTAIEQIQSRLGSQRRQRNMKRITKFIEAMAQLGQVVEVFLNVDSTVALIWGPIKFVLLTASTWVETLDLLLDTYAEIGEILPGLTQFQRLLGKYPYLKMHLENYYCNVLDFHINALDVFSRPAWKTVFHSAWKTFKTRFGPILSNLKRHREILSDEKLSIAISEVRDVGELLGEQLESRKKQMMKLQLDEKEQDTLKFQEQRSRRLQFVLNKFGIVDCQGDLEHARYEHRHHGSSGDWLFDDPQFKEWADLTMTRNSTLCLHGIPGAGKTILTSRVVKHLKQLKSYNSAQGHVFSVVYFYFNQMDPGKSTLTGLLLTLLSQLIHQDDVLLEQTYQRCLAIDQQKIYSSDTIRDLASVAFKSQRLCFVILDGLDECVGNPSANPAEEQEQVIHWVKSLTTDTGMEQSGNCETCIRLFISSQRDGIFEKQLRLYPSIQLESAGAHSRDIESYAKRRSAEMRKKFRISAEEERELVNRVTSGAKGMFLYAKVVLSNLLNQVSIYHFKQEMKAENFPEGIEEAYKRVVVRVLENPSEPQRLAAKSILSLLICAERSLMWKEIQSRFCIDVDTETADTDRQLLDTCKDLCGSLVEIERNQVTESKPDDVVELVHHTARGYLVQSGRLCISGENANMTLFCARYITSLPFTLGLSGSEIEKHAVTGYYGFQDYAAAFWWKHAYRMIGTSIDINTDLYNRTLQAVARAMELYGDFKNSLHEPHDCPSHAVQRQLKELGEDAREWENNFRIEFRTRAIRNIVEPLLSKGDASSILTLYGPVRYKCHKPWCHSFYNGFELHQDREQHLSEHDRPFRCSLESCYGNKFGFPSESDLGRHNENHHLAQSTVHFPSPRPSKTGIDINTTTATGGGKTPLYLAAEKGHVHICQYLLEQGANVNFKGILINDEFLDLNESSNRRHAFDLPLHIAARRGLIEIVKLLLSSGRVDLNTADQCGRRALHHACEYGHDSVVELLLPVIDDLNAKDHDGTTPFQYATRGRHWGVIKLLFEKGADMELDDDDSQTLLSLA